MSSKMVYVVLIIILGVLGISIVVSPWISDRIARRSIPLTVNDVLESALNANINLESYNVLLERVHQKKIATGQIETVGTESYQFTVVRREERSNRIVWEADDSKKQDTFFSIDVDGILKSKDDYLVRIQEIQKSNGRTFYFVEMRHKVAKLVEGQQPIIQLRIAEDNWMVYDYHLLVSESTEITDVEFEYDLIQGFWLPVKITTRLFSTGDIFTDAVSYSQFEIRNSGLEGK